MTLDPQSQVVIDAFNASGLVPFRRHGAHAVRQKVLALRAARPSVPTHEMFSVTEETISTPDGSFRVRILRPRPNGPGETLPVLIYLHGGGYFMGGIDESDELARRLAKQADVVVINVEYHLSPEVRFPVAVNDAYATLCWTAANATRLGVDPDRIVVSGDSAGGNLTIVTCLQSRAHGGPAIRLQIPIYPSVDLRPRPPYPSRLEWGRGDYLLDTEDIEWMMEMYLKDGDDRGDWRISPILADSYAGLPPALVLTASQDPLCDEGRIYAERLAADGVAVEYAEFAGTFHGFLSYCNLIDVGSRAADRICDFIRTSLQSPTSAKG